MSAPEAGCVGEPVSWLRLERRRLGELPAAERAAVDAHLAACAACAACAAEAERPLPLRPLPVPAAPARSRIARLLRALLFPAGVAGGAAAAAAALVLVLRARPDPDRDIIKGSGVVAIALVRDRAGAIEHDATTFAPDDRWKVLVTCSDARPLFWDLVVRDGGGAAAGAAVTFPLANATPITCGNHVSLPGAVRLSGAAALDVCLVLAPHPVDRGRLAALPPAALAAEATCTTVRPAAE